MSNVTWANNAGGDFGTAANWAGGLPTSSSNVIINTATIQTVTFGAIDNFTVNSLSVGDDNFDMGGGALTVSTTVAFAAEFQLTGGTLSVNDGATFTDGYYQDGGTLYGTGAIAISGSNAQTGGQAAQFLDGNAEGALQFTNNGTMTIANYTFGGATQFANKSVLDESGGITLGDATAIDATINNATGATFDIAGDYGISEGAISANCRFCDQRVDERYT
jgi:hypothetical protein